MQISSPGHMSGLFLLLCTAGTIRRIVLKRVSFLCCSISTKH